MSGRACTTESETELLQRLRFEVDRIERDVVERRGVYGFRPPDEAEAHRMIEQAATLSEFRRAIAMLTLGTWRQSPNGHFGPPPSEGR